MKDYLLMFGLIFLVYLFSPVSTICAQTDSSDDHPGGKHPGREWVK